MTRRYTKRQGHLFAAQEKNFDQLKNLSTIFLPSEAFVAWVRERFPHKPAAQIAYLTGCSMRSAYHYLDGTELPAKAIFAALATSYGPEIMSAVFADRPPQWWQPERMRMSIVEANGGGPLQRAASA